MKTTLKNAFEHAIILIKEGVATDIGVCTWVDDDRITVEFGEEVQAFSRYADGREDDELPPVVAWIGLRQFAQEVADLKVTIDDEVKDWLYNGEKKEPTKIDKAEDLAGPAGVAFAESLAKLDWYYSYSDDGSVYRRGDVAYKAAQATRKEMGECGDLIWAMYAPSGF
jgi:hypothetical protein